MTRSVLALAALATVAVPGLDIYQAKSAPAPEGFEAALILDSEARQWIVRAPLSAASGAALEGEAALLRALAPFVDSGTLPFVIPQPHGFTPLDEGGKAVVYPHVMGNPLNLARLVPGPGVSAHLGRAIGAIHSLPIRVIEDAGFPVYSAEQYRNRRLAELDEGASTGRVPVPLLRRWESALENVTLWRFQPVVTHTSLSEDSVIMAHGQVSGITDWSSARVGDPADDLAWLVAGAPVDCVDSIFEAYQLQRKDSLDPHLIDRALLGSELALLGWLLHGTRTGNQEVIADAESMLADLVEATSGNDNFTLTHELAGTEVGAEKVQRVRMIGDTGKIAVAATESGAQGGSDTESSTESGTKSDTGSDARASSSSPTEAHATVSESPSFVEVPEDAEPTSWSLGVDSAPVQERAAGRSPWTGSTASATSSGSESSPRSAESAASARTGGHPVTQDSPADASFIVPDYERAHPPMPYADNATEMMVALDADDLDPSDDAISDDPFDRGN